MNIVDLFIEICCFSDHKNETLIKFLNLDNKRDIRKNMNNLIRTKLLQLKKNTFSNNKKNQSKTFSYLIYEIANNSLEKYNYAGNELEFIISKNNSLNLEKLSVLYKYYPDTAIFNVELIYKNFKNGKYIFSDIDGFEESSIEIENIIDKNELSKLNSKIYLLNLDNKSLESKNKESLREINKILNINSKLEKQNKVLKDEKEVLEKNNVELLKKIELLEKNINNYEIMHKHSVVVDKSFCNSEEVKFCMIHNTNLKVLPKIHTDIKFIDYKDINGTEIEKFITNLKKNNINSLFIQSNNIKQLNLNTIIVNSRKQNLKCFRIFFNNEKELNEKLCKLK